MGTFWFAYLLVLVCWLSSIEPREWRECRRYLAELFWPLVLRGGLVLGGIHWIWVAINSYLTH
jgi:hypothetical protein